MTIAHAAEAEEVGIRRLLALRTRLPLLANADAAAYPVEEPVIAQARERSYDGRLGQAGPFHDRQQLWLRSSGGEIEGSAKDRLQDTDAVRLQRPPRSMLLVHDIEFLGRLQERVSPGQPAFLRAVLYLAPDLSVRVINVDAVAPDMRVRPTPSAR